MNIPDQPKPPTCNPEKLFRELQAAAISIESVDAHGRATYQRALTPPESSLSDQLIKNHTPEDDPPTLSEELFKAGITPELRLEALWSAVIEQDDTRARTIQHTISAIQAKQAHESN